MSRRILIFLSVLAIVTRHEVNSIVGIIGDIGTLTNFANDALAYANKELPAKDLAMGSTGYMLGVLKDGIDELAATLKQMEFNNERRMTQMLDTLTSRLTAENKLEFGFDDLHEIIVKIDTFYEDFEYYRNDLENFEEDTIIKFSDRILDYDLAEILERMHRLILPGRSSSYKQPLQKLLLHTDSLKPFNELCGLGTSTQQRLYEIYQTVAISEIRACLMFALSYKVRRINTDRPYDAEMEMTVKKFLKRSYSYLTATKEAMANASLALDVCDPEKYDRGDNFHELEKAIQMLVIKEMDFGYKGDHLNVCWDECDNMQSGSVRNPSCDRSDKNEWCPTQACRGSIRFCQSSGTTSLCEMPKNSRRRYGWVKDQNGTTYGNTKSCPGFRSNAVWFPWLPHACDICICTCIEELGTSPAIRTINLRPALSNIQENMVVIGVKFVSSDKMIQIQILEGKLLPGGRIQEDGQRWLDLERFEYFKYGVIRSRKIGTFKLLKNDQSVELQHGTDYAHIWVDQKKMHLDELIAPHGYVVTGVKFQHSNYDTNEMSTMPLQLAIRVTKFDFKNGELDQASDSSYWMFYENLNNNQGYNHHRNQVDLADSDDPTNLKGHGVVSVSDQVIEFRATDRIKDAGQTTIPLFDGQSVVSTMSFPLSGLSLIHRGAAGSGGFLAFRLHTLDLPEFLDTQLHEETLYSFQPEDLV